VPSNFGLLTTIAYKFGSGAVHYALEGGVAISGALVQWLRDNLGLIQKSSDVRRLAHGERQRRRLLVPAFSGLYAPYWKENARGVIAGSRAMRIRAHCAGGPGSDGISDT